MTEPPYTHPYDSAGSPPPHAPSTDWGYGQPQGGYPPSAPHLTGGGGYPAMPMSPGGPGRPMMPGGPPAPQGPNRRTLALILGAAGVAAILLMAGLITVVALARGSDDDRRADPVTIASDPPGSAAPGANPAPTGPNASAARPDAGAEYRAPQELCTKLDFAPLTAIFGGVQGSPSTSRSEYDIITVSCGAVLRQGTKSAIATISGHFAGSGTAASRDYEYQVSSAKGTYAPKNGIREIPDAGDKAFAFKWDSSSGATATFQLWILDGNLTFSASALGSVSSGTWTKDDEDKVFAALTTLGTAALGKLKG